MVSHQLADQPQENFQGLLLQLRGRTGLSQTELALRIGRHARSIQGWESGTHFPTVESLQALLLAYLTANAFTVGHESAEAATVWAAPAEPGTTDAHPF
jgi:transcriptional regulator with XRE-family HTH domain